MILATHAGDLCALRISGRDRLAFLQTKLTCDTRDWRRTGGSYGLAVDINGRIVFEGYFSIDGEAVLAVVHAGLRDAAVAHLDRYVIMEDVQLSRLDAAVIRLSGDDLDLAAGLVPGALPRAAVPSSRAVGAIGFASTGPVGEPRAFVLCPPDQVDEVLGALAAVAAQVVGAEELASWELARGVPALGRDYFVDRTIPIEAGLWAGVSLSKGCYLGQEVLERMFSRGSAARRLVAVRWAGDPVAPGTPLIDADGTEFGEVTACVASHDGVRGIASLRRRALEGEVPLVVGALGARVIMDGLVGGEPPAAP